MVNYQDWREPFEVFGSWYSSDSDDRFGGLLRWDPADGAELQLAGGGATWWLRSWREHETLVGHADGRVITMVRPFATDGDVLPTGTYVGRFFANSILVGPTALSDANPRVNEVRLELAQVGELLAAVHRTETGEVGQTSGLATEEHVVVHDQPVNGMTLKLVGGMKRVGTSDRLESYGSAHIQFDTPVRIAPSQERVVLDLVSLRMNRPAEHGAVRRVVNSVLEGGPTTAEAFYLFESFRRPRTPRDNHPPAVTLGSMGEVRSVLVGWLSSYDDLRPVLNLRVADLYKPTLHAETRFQNSVQAIEGFHRRTERFSTTDAVSVEMRKQAMQAAADNTKLSTWLAAKLRYVAQPSLRMRIEEVINDLEKRDIGDKPQRAGRFCGRVVDLRNGLAHQLPDSDAGRNAQELMHLGDLLDAMLDVMVLDRAGAHKTSTQSAAREVLELIDKLHETPRGD